MTRVSEPKLVLKHSTEMNLEGVANYLRDCQKKWLIQSDKYTFQPTGAIADKTAMVHEFFEKNPQLEVTALRTASFLQLSGNGLLHLNSALAKSKLPLIDVDRAVLNEGKPARGRS